MLRADPRLLLVRWHGKIRLELSAHKPMVIVGGGIDEVPQDLFARPASAVRYRRGYILRNGSQTRGMECRSFRKVSREASTVVGEENMLYSTGASYNRTDAFP